MLKLLICLVSSFALAVVMLQLREQRRELGFQTNALHDEIEAHQAKLWNQQLQIAVYTAPNAIARTVGTHDLKMVPPTTLPAVPTGWIDAANPDAE
ncbi:MAG TPA: hypothetical protein VK324_01110 [Tepidisphaeraceae bacterium]|nr:hypothetical protein [Tepidisphaeraceae bacterium]